MKKNNKLVLAAFGLAALTSTFAWGTETYVEKAIVDTVPWSSSYWPHKDGNIIAPLEKYDAVTNKHAAEWEKTKHPSGSNVPAWHGYCHGWSAAAIMEKEPDGSVTSGNVEFGVSDQKALLTLCHANDVVNFYGKRFQPGDSVEERADLTPDQVLVLLRRYVRDLKLPLVMDVNAGEQVWNFPAYTYRAEYSFVDGKCYGSLEIGFVGYADPETVRTSEDYASFSKIRTYTFTIDAPDGNIVLGSGKWTGDSVQNHPDFAWSPFVQRAESPEIDYDLVKTILAGQTVNQVESGNAISENSTSSSERETNASSSTSGEGQDDNPAQTPAQGQDDNPAQTPAQGQDDNPAQTPAQGQDDNPAQTDCVTLDIVRVLKTLKTNNVKSDWNLSVRVNGLHGQMLSENEVFSVSIDSKKPGYLSLALVDSEGNVRCVPMLTSEGKTYKIEEGLTYFPNEGSDPKFRTRIQLRPPYGACRVYAIVSEKPVEFTASSDSKWTIDNSRRGENVTNKHAIRIETDDEASVQGVADNNVTIAELREKLGAFAYSYTGFVLTTKEKINEMIKNGY